MAITQVLMVWQLAIPSSLLWVHFPQWLLAILCTIFSAAAGYLFNDRLDVDVDEVNKPGKNITANWSEAAFWIVYLLLSLISIACAYFISPGTARIAVGVVALLFFYNVQLKRIPVAGNIVVALLSALAVVFPALAEIPMRAGEVAIYGLFAFWVSLLREMAKDAEDKAGDAVQGRVSVATLLSTGTFNYLMMALHALLFLGIFWVLTNYEHSTWWWYWTVVISIFSLVILVFIFTAKETKHYSRLSFYYKILMLAGICSLFFWS